MKVDSRLPPLAEEPSEHSPASNGTGVTSRSPAPAGSPSVSPLLEALSGGKPRRTALGGASGFGDSRPRAALLDITRTRPTPQRMTLAQLFEQEDREARAQSAFNQPLTEIGEDGLEEEGEDEPQGGVRNEIKAIGIARSLGMANTVAEAVDDAKAIVDAARNLRQTQRAETLPKPPSPDKASKRR